MKLQRTGQIVALASLIAIPAVYAQEKTVEKPAPKLTLIRDVKIFGGHSPGLKAGSVLIKDNLIEAVGADVPAPAEATIVDGKGGSLMPGLIDMHSHLVIHEGMLDGRDNLDQMAIGAITAEKMRDYLDQGFTTARDAGAYADILVVNGDPIADLELVRDRDNRQLLVKDGKVWKNTLVPAEHPEHTPSLERHQPSGTL